MKMEQRHWTVGANWHPARAALGPDANLVMVFGETSLVKSREILGGIQAAYPNALLFGCSTSGEIQGTRVYDDSVTTTAIQFEKTKVKMASVQMSEAGTSYEAGKKLAAAFDHSQLTHILVFSVGLNINGGTLVKGLSENLPKHVSITGGLAGDKDRFKETLVIAGDQISNEMVAAVGLYGSQIQISSASLGGWDAFGPVRNVTKSSGNVLYELDGKSALSLYKSYLGDHVKDLPGSALLFPLCLSGQGHEEGVVRTVLAVNENEQSMTFAGDIPMGCNARFMKANFDRLIDGAIGAAERSRKSVQESRPELALLISCVGRKIVLKQRVEEEVEGVRSIFGDQTVLTGFYSYGEISPFTPNAKCELHNQTMTITTLTEKDEEAA